MSVAELAINTGAGRSLVFDAVNAAFEGFAPSDAHRMVTDFNWRAIASTNYDLFLEGAYDDTRRRRQVLVPFVKDDEPIDARKGEVVNPVEYLKLHGCLRHRLDKDIPLVLSWEQYDEYGLNRKHLFSRLSYLAHECPIIFIGYGLADSHIRSLIYKLEASARPRWYIVDPGAEEEDTKLWNSKNIEVIKCRFGDFMQALDEAIPKLLRFVAPSAETVNFPLRAHYTTQTSQETDGLRTSLAKDLTLVHATMAFKDQTAEHFYSGYDTGWGGIINRMDARRKVTDDLLFKALLEHADPTEPLLFLLRGPAGAGKTIALKRAAFDAATANNVVALWLEESGQLRPDVFSEIFELTHRPIYLFVDQVALHVEKLALLLKAMKARRVPLVLIGAEREADWTTYCLSLESILAPVFLRVGMLSSREVGDLLDLLERHNCLGDLTGKTRSDQVAAFMDEERADRQLLVALHELTRGYPFEKIVLDEYERVPEKARRLYLDIATMHQFAVSVRAGTISRVSGIRFKDYQKEFMVPLKDMIIVAEDRYDDYFYRTRHPSIASMIFIQVCGDDEAKAAQFVRLIQGFDVGYSSDRRTLEGICKGRVLARQFQAPDGARDVFGTATSVAPNHAYLRQQWAIFEMNHEHGDLRDAERLAAEAAAMDSKNSSFIHTQAEVARRRANAEASPVLRDQLRRQARRFLEEMPKQDRFCISSRCKLAVDEIADLIENLSDQERVTDDRFFADKLQDTERSLTRAQQQFPQDPEMVETEARLWSLMKDKTKALRALERAWKKMPRGSGTAIRISKIHTSAGRPDAARSVLEEALSRNPEDKLAHFEMSMHLLSSADPAEWDRKAISHHLGSSFQVNDANFEERFTLGQFLFATGFPERAEAVFDEIERRAPKEFRRFAPKADSVLTKGLPVYSGIVDSVRHSHFMLRSGTYPQRIFSHRSAFEEAEVDEIEVGHQVYFRLRFNRRGPVAVSVHLNPSGWNSVGTELSEPDLEIPEMVATPPLHA
ncbi:SIR2 family protein [Falsiroseomonas sp. HC035]|uniref:P-loop NTPase n=1 Tax=Falsiroseomonas sp. HC035 TaxID=3390999 RepID=UPI003D32000A